MLELDHMYNVTLDGAGGIATVQGGADSVMWLVSCTSRAARPSATGGKVPIKSFPWFL